MIKILGVTLAYESPNYFGVGVWGGGGGGQALIIGGR